MNYKRFFFSTIGTLISSLMCLFILPITYVIAIFCAIILSSFIYELIDWLIGNYKKKE